MTDEDLANRAAGKLPPRLHAHADMDILTLLYNPEGAAAGLLHISTAKSMLLPAFASAMVPPVQYGICAGNLR